MKKKTLFFVLAIISLFSLLSINVFAANYPSAIFSVESSTTIPQGETGAIKFTILRKFNNEKFHLRMYNSSGALVASLDKSFGSSYSSIVEYTIEINTNALGLAVGKYKMEYWMEFYSFYEWHEAPNRYTETIQGLKNVCKGTHSLFEWVTLSEPTCSKEGATMFKCSKCGHQVYKKTTAPHIYGSWSYADSSSHKKVCITCNASINEDHTWNNGTVTKAATCAEEGIFTYTCLVCNGTKTVSIPKTNEHSFNAWKSIGSNEHSRKCDVCGLNETGTHNFKDSWTKNKNGHWHECSFCKTRVDYSEHDIISSDNCSVCGIINVPGDVNNSETVDADDAIYLLYHVFFGNECYPIEQECDFNESGSIDADDAIYLLYHVFFGENTYPLN